MSKKEERWIKPNLESIAKIPEYAYQESDPFLLEVRKRLQNMGLGKLPNETGFTHLVACELMKIAASNNTDGFLKLLIDIFESSENPGKYVGEYYKTASQIRDNEGLGFNNDAADSVILEYLPKK